MWCVVCVCGVCVVCGVCGVWCVWCVVCVVCVWCGVCGALIRSKLPEDGVLTPKHAEVILILNLHCLFARMLV